MNNFGKMDRFRPGDHDGHTGSTLGVGWALAAESHHRLRGLGVSFGADSKGWKPQKAGGCWWTRCPWDSDLSHTAEDMADSCLLASMLLLLIVAPVVDCVGGGALSLCPSVAYARMVLL